MKSPVDERVMLRFQFQINIPSTCIDSPRQTSIFLAINYSKPIGNLDIIIRRYCFGGVRKKTIT